MKQQELTAPWCIYVLYIYVATFGISAACPRAQVPEEAVGCQAVCRCLARSFTAHQACGKRERGKISIPEL